jgi:hypothetical protein
MWPPRRTTEAAGLVSKRTEAGTINEILEEALGADPARGDPAFASTDTIFPI